MSQNNPLTRDDLYEGMWLSHILNNRFAYRVKRVGKTRVFIDLAYLRQNNQSCQKLNPEPLFLRHLSGYIEIEEPDWIPAETNG